MTEGNHEENNECSEPEEKVVKVYNGHQYADDITIISRTKKELEEAIKKNTRRKLSVKEQKGKSKEEV